MKGSPPRLSVAEAVERARELAAAASPFRRTLLGITGPPGAGKSTLSGRILAAVPQGRAMVVGMDGFHLADSLLRELGRSDRKGAPDTFDADAYVNLLTRLQDRTRQCFAPVFDRSRELAEVGALLVPAGLPLIVTEGNYLLLDDGPWGEVADLLDVCWYVDVDDSVRRARLAERHMAYGVPASQAQARTLGSDEANALYIRRTRHLADALVVLD